MIMKRNLLLAIATLLLAGSFATAQDWKAVSYTHLTLPTKA